MKRFLFGLIPVFVVMLILAFIVELAYLLVTYTFVAKIFCITILSLAFIIFTAKLGEYPLHKWEMRQRKKRYEKREREQESQNNYLGF